MANIITADYYETLQLTREATQEDIKEAYRNLSLRFLPTRATESAKQIYEYKFHQIAEAYIVLSDPNKKGIYDIYGKEGLYNGIRDPTTGDIKGGFKYLGNAMEIFNEYMNSTNPYSLIRENERMDDELGSIFANAFGGANQAESKPLKDIEEVLECTLEEMYNGAIKELVYNRSALSLDKRTTDIVENKVEVEIFPGYDEGTIVKFPGLGNEAPGQKSSDLIVKLKLKNHEKFQRVNKNDLIYTCQITLSQALNSQAVEIETLDGRRMNICIDEIISPRTVKKVPGEGMPVYCKETNTEEYVFGNKKGDLYIRFYIKFPNYINGKKKERIIALLNDN